MKHENKTFTGTVELDDNEFIGCTFENCTLVYSGGKPPLITGGQFRGCKFEFRGHAADTVAFLQAMASPNSGMQGVIRDTFPALSAH